MNKETMMVQAIGVVKGTPGRQQLIIHEPYRSALNGLEQFSHALIVWWAHKVTMPEAKAMWTTSLPYAPGKTAGVFATRTPQRPNPIGIDVCHILSVDEATGLVEIPFIDALDGTPILDIKGYYPVNDRIRDVRTPVWADRWPEWVPETEAEGKAWMKILSTWK